MYDNENPNGFGSNPEGNNDDNISGTENNNFEEVNSQQVSQDAVNSSEQNTEQTAEQESSVYRQSYVNDEHHNADDVSGNGTYYSQGSNNSSNDSTQNGSYYNSNSNNSQNNGYYYSTNDSQTNNGYNYNSNNNNNGNGKKKKKKRTLIAVVAVCVVLLAGTIGISAAYISKNKDSLTNVLEDGTLSNNDNNSNSKNDNSSDSGNYESIGSTNTQNDANSSSKSGVTVTDVSSVVSSAMPSVVAITSKTLVESRNDYSQDIWEYYFGGGNSGNNKSNSYEEDAAGSGIIVDQTSTNNHVVEGADSLKIQFAGTESKDSVDGYIKGTDSTKDVAVVAVKLKDIPSDVLKNIKKATLGDSDKVNVGEGVIAIGNALGYGQSVTTGIISAKDRKVQLENQTMTLLQTDAAINGGNSGGALLNASGEVIGINVAKYSSSGSSSNASVEGMGFAIPISSVKDIISNLETKETRTKVSEDERGYLGISGFDVDEQTSQAYSIPQGIQVQSVVKGGPAENAGIAASDVITKFDGQDVSSMTSLQSMLEYYKKGEQVKVTIEYRDGREYKTKDVTVTLGDKSVIETTQNAAN